MKVREITSPDRNVYEKILKLIPQLDPQAALPSFAAFEELISSESAHLFIAGMENDDIAGMLTLSIYPIPTGQRAWIDDVVVDTGFRGRGIGRALMLRAIDFAGSAGAKSVDLTSRPFRIAANNMYREMGFMLRETNVYRYTFKED